MTEALLAVIAIIEGAQLYYLRRPKGRRKLDAWKRQTRPAGRNGMP